MALVPLSGYIVPAALLSSPKENVLMRQILLCTLLFLPCALLPDPAHAHAQGEHYLWLTVDKTELVGNIELSADDLSSKLGFDLDLTVDIDDQAMQPYRQELEQYLLKHVGFASERGDLQLRFTGLRARNAGEGNYVKVDFIATDGQPVGSVITVRDSVFFDDDTQHRGILLIAEDRRTGEKYREREVLVFSPFNTEQRLDLDNPPRLLSRLQFIWQGMLHIFIGLDHVLFLITLLLTAVLANRDGRREPVESFGQALWQVFKIVTLFTIAHSVTLFLAGLGYVQLPARLVESIIALSIIVVALNNLLSRFDYRKLWIILGFGLFHGLGFASVMADLPFRMVNLLGVVLFFNIGVEFGQIVVVAVVFPLLYFARRQGFYQPVVVVGGSLAVTAVAAWWLVQRALGLG